MTLSLTFHMGRERGRGRVVAPDGLDALAEMLDVTLPDRTAVSGIEDWLKDTDAVPPDQESPMPGNILGLVRRGDKVEIDIDGANLECTVTVAELRWALRAWKDALKDKGDNVTVTFKEGPHLDL